MTNGDLLFSLSSFPFFLISPSPLWSLPVTPALGLKLHFSLFFPVIAGFNRLRQEQRGLASKAAELEMELNEHSLVIDTLKEVDETRKCYRMVGGVLVERTVKEVLPALEGNKEQIQKIIETLSQQLQAKGKELNEFREKHNIRLMGEDEKPAAKENSEGAGAKSSSAGVLVS
uniref:Prefoldin subunit 2 n=1 Tax=Rattus norvegicus TaxID=10116 RepID=A0ABK0LML1_RAT